ncbi:MAG: hypothetical protein AAFQ84_00900, partial [Pseudomonadota bacterium]
PLKVVESATERQPEVVDDAVIAIYLEKRVNTPPKKLRVTVSLGGLTHVGEFERLEPRAEGQYGGFSSLKRAHSKPCGDEANFAFEVIIRVPPSVSQPVRALESLAFPKSTVTLRAKACHQIATCSRQNLEFPQ